MQHADGRSARIIDSLETAHALFGRAFAKARDERLYVAHLASDFRLIGLRVRFADPGQAVEFPVRKIIADALTLSTHSLILAHNHPSGDSRPSTTDLEATRNLVQVARPLGINVRDHLIYAGGHFTSLRRDGLL